MAAVATASTSILPDAERLVSSVSEESVLATLEILLLTVGILTPVASDLLLPAIFPPA